MQHSVKPTSLAKLRRDLKTAAAQVPPGSDLARALRRATHAIERAERSGKSGVSDRE